jgi:hypothetical protein
MGNFAASCEWGLKIGWQRAAEQAGYIWKNEKELVYILV